MKIRTGSCKRCGRCCQSKYIYSSYNFVEKIAIRLRIWIAGRKFNINDKCKSLYMRHGKAHCKKYDNRPEFCKRFPEGEFDLLPGCGYNFERGQK